MENEILVFGHKSPDTDTICSCIVAKWADKDWEDKKK